MDLAMKELTMDQMEQSNGGMPCALALAFYGIAFIGGAAVTGGASLLVIITSAASLTSTIWGVVDSCKNVL